MGCVQLNKLQLQANRTPGRVYESVSDAHHFAVTQRHRRMLPVRKSHGARCDRGPAIRSAREKSDSLQARDIGLEALRPACASWMPIGMGE